MRKYLLFIILFIWAKSNSQLSTNRNENLITYYGLVNKAELALVNSENKVALKLYEDAFRIRKYGFANDYFNAALLSAIIGDNKKTYNYFKELSKLGLDPRTFKSIEILKNFWLSKYGLKAELLDSITPKIYNSEYRFTVLKLVERDQLFRNKKNAYTLYKDTINSIDKENIQILLSLISKYGFPSERLTGLNRNGLGLPAATLIIHQNLRKDRIFDFSQILKNAVYSGDFKNKDASYFIEGNTGRLNGIYNPYSLMRASYDSSLISLDKSGTQIKKDSTFYTKWGYSKLPDSSAIKMELNRSDLFLEPLADALKKDIFRLTLYPDFALGAPDSGVTWRRVRFSEFIFMKEHLTYIY